MPNEVDPSHSCSDTTSTSTSTSTSGSGSTSDASSAIPAEGNTLQVKYLSHNLTEHKLSLQFPTLPISVATLREAVANAAGIPLDTARLIFRGRILHDNQSTSEYGIENGTTLHLVTKPPTSSTDSDSNPASSSSSSSSSLSSSSNIPFNTSNINADPSQSSSGSEQTLPPVSRRLVGILSNASSQSASEAPQNLSSFFTNFFSTFEATLDAFEQGNTTSELVNPLPPANPVLEPSSTHVPSSSTPRPPIRGHVELYLRGPFSRYGRVTIGGRRPRASQSRSPTSSQTSFNEEQPPLSPLSSNGATTGPRPLEENSTFSSTSRAHPSSETSFPLRSFSLFHPLSIDPLVSTDMVSHPAPSSVTSSYTQAVNSVEATVSLVEQAFSVTITTRRAISLFDEFLRSTSSTLTSSDPIQVRSALELFLAERSSSTLSHLVSHFSLTSPTTISNRIDDLFFMHRQLCSLYANHSSNIASELNGRLSSSTETPLSAQIAWQAHAYISSSFAISSQYIARLVSATCLTPQENSTFLYTPTQATIIQHGPVASPIDSHATSGSILLQLLQAWIRFLDEHQQRNSFLSPTAPYIPSAITPLSDIIDTSSFTPVLQLLLQGITVAQALQFIPHPRLFYNHVHPILNHFIRNVVSNEHSAQEEVIPHLTNLWTCQFLELTNWDDIFLDPNERSAFITIAKEALQTAFRKLIILITLSPDPALELFNWCPSLFREWKSQLSTTLYESDNQALFLLIRKIILSFLLKPHFLDVVFPSSSFLSALADSIARYILVL